MNNDNMDKLKHEHGITDEHGYHKNQHQVHHAGHDHCGHSGHNHSEHSGHDHSGHSGHAHHHHGSFKELFLKSLPLGIIIMFFSPLHGFKLPFQFTFPYSDIVVAILSTILIMGTIYQFTPTTICSIFNNTKKTTSFRKSSLFDYRFLP